MVLTLKNSKEENDLKKQCLTDDLIFLDNLRLGKYDVKNFDQALLYIGLALNIVINYLSINLKNVDPEEKNSLEIFEEDLNNSIKNRFKVKENFVVLVLAEDNSVNYYFEKDKFLKNLFEVAKDE